MKKKRTVSMICIILFTHGFFSFLDAMESAVVKETSSHEIPPLHAAIMEGNEKVVIALLQSGADINQHYEGMPVLHTAILGGKEGIVECFLNIPGIDVNEKDAFGNTPLMYAVRRAFNPTLKDFAHKIVVLLVEKGVCISLRDRKGRNAYYYIYKMLAAQKGLCTTSIKIVDVLQKACGKGGVSVPWKNIFDYLYSLGLRDFSSTMLALAFELRNEELIRYLVINEGIESLIKENDKSPCLHELIVWGNTILISDSAIYTP